MSLNRKSWTVACAVLCVAGEVVVAEGGETRTFERGARVLARTFTAADAGSVWRGEAGGKSELRGESIALCRAAFASVPAKDAAIRARLPKESVDRVLVADVSARLPATIPEPPAGTFSGATRHEDRYMEHIVNEPMGALIRPLLFVNDSWMTRARWPDAGFVKFYETPDPGVGFFDARAKGVAPRGGTIAVVDEHTRRWPAAGGFLLNGFFACDWDNGYTRVAGVSVEGTNTLLRLAGHQHYKLGSNPPRRFFALDLPEELDRPGEWWFDRAKKKVYAIPPKGDAFAATDELVLATGERPILQGDGVRDLRFENLVFSCAGGDLVRFTHATNVVFENCVFRNAGGIALVLEGASNVVRNCRFEGMGGQCVNLQGGDRVNLIGCGNLVEGCTFRDFGKIVRAYAPAIYLDGCGSTIRRCTFRDAPHSAILFGGNDHVIESCDISHVLAETADAGAVYSGRDWTGQGNVLRWNYVHDLPSPQDMVGWTIGFYFDDCECGDAVHGNVFEGLHRGVFVGGGRDHPMTGNVFVNCYVGVSFDSRGRTWAGLANTLGNEMKARFKYNEDPWASRYPNLARIFEDEPESPRHNPVDGNLFWSCGLTPMSAGVVQEFMKDIVFTNNVTVTKEEAKGRWRDHPFVKSLPADHPALRNR